MKKIITLLMVSELLSGCTTQWVKKSINAEDFTSAKAACEALGDEKFPVKNQVAQRTKYTPYYRPCSKREGCEKEKYITFQRPETESYVIDVNQDSRRELFYQCMSLRGWISETKWF